MTFCWTAGVLALAVSASVSPALLVMAYPVVSLVVSRYLRGQLVYHRVYDTVENVSGAKLAMFLYWPVALPVLIFKLSIVRAL